MGLPDQLSDLTNELFRRVGRNLLNFQRIEGMLKFLLANGQISGPIAEILRIREARTQSIHRKTMGELAGQFAEEILADAGEVEPEHESGDGKRAWIAFSIRIEAEAASNAEFRDGLRALVQERNDLVHHFGSRWDSKSIETTRELLLQLDEQRERLIPLFERIRAIVLSMQEGMREQAAFLASPEGQRPIEQQWLRQSPLVRLLADCVIQMARPDGWLPLATAGHYLQRQAPDQVASLKDRYGYATLKRLVVATDLFDIQDESTARGFRTVYRLRNA